MSDQTKFKIGDRVKFDAVDNDTDYGIITEKEGSIYTESGDVWALWDGTRIMQHASPKSLTLIEYKESVMLKITQIEQQLQELKELLKD